MPGNVGLYPPEGAAGTRPLSESESAVFIPQTLPKSGSGQTVPMFLDEQWTDKTHFRVQTAIQSKDMAGRPTFPNLLDFLNRTVFI